MKQYTSDSYDVAANHKMANSKKKRNKTAADSTGVVAHCDITYSTKLGLQLMIIIVID